MFGVIILQLKQDYTVCFEDPDHRRGWDVEVGKKIGKVFKLLSTLRRKLILGWKQDTGHEELKDKLKGTLPPE